MEHRWNKNNKKNVSRFLVHHILNYLKAFESLWNTFQDFRKWRNIPLKQNVVRVLTTYGFI